MGEPVPPVGREVGDVFLPAAQGDGRISPADLMPGEEPAPVLVRLAMNGRPCRLTAVSDGDEISCWGEVIGDRSTTGLNELSGLTGQIQSLLTQVRKQHEQLQQDLKAAAWLQSRFLPKLGQIADVQAAWKFRPCAGIGGDFFNFFPLSDGTLAAYILDASGHGVPAAMMGVAAVQALQQLIGLQENAGTKRQSMNALLVRLEEEFPIDRFNRYFTMVYLEIDRSRKSLSWVNAGHLPPIFHRRGEIPVALTGGGPLIGLGGAGTTDERQLELKPGDRLYLYSDGVTERRNASGEQFGDERLMASLARGGDRSLRETVEAAIADDDAFGAPDPAGDDLTLLGIELNARHEEPSERG